MMPEFLEKKLKAEYGANSKTPYKVMNAIGAMRGSKETAKGRAMEARHDRDTKKRKKQPQKDGLREYAKNAGKGML